MVRRKVQNTKKLREERLLEENFGIIERDPKNKQYFICRLCEKEGNLFYAGLWNNCESHLESKGHKSALLVHEDQIEGSISSNSSVKSQDSLKFDNTLTDMIEGELDIMYTQFILQYRLPFSIAKPLHALITETSATYNNNLLEQYQISGKIISKAANSFSSTIKNELLEEIRKSPFSLSLDASSDLHGNTYLAVCVRYLEQENEQAPACKLFTILPLTTSSTGETIYKMIKEELLNEEAV